MFSTSKAHLPEPRRRLLELMQRTGFGRIENLVIRSGDPVVDPPPLTIREIRFGGENGPRPELAMADYRLKSQVVELFAEFDRLADRTIDVLIIKYGLPFRMEIREREPTRFRAVG